ncbi:MAG TPA: Vms1/Ankzf1 family peptidyl-tRNA hydrolase [Longimicrobiales bacterium]|nr:Vms1/Ankzf1 family peptidyl-tRNA hydrolase [Longimicrobiales bacterium]
MISREDVTSLMESDPEGRTIVSVFLDMSVNSDNKRTYSVFLNKERSRREAPDADPAAPSRDVMADVLGRVEAWIETEFDEGSRGVAAYVDLDGSWMRVLQLPVPLENRITVAERPSVAPLLEVMNAFHHHGVVLVDREHLRMLSLYMDQAVREVRVDTEPFPAPHDVQRGGYSQKGYQSRKEEETRHFFKDFAAEVERFVTRFRPDDLILLGTDENVKKFKEFLSPSLREKVVHTAHAPVEATPKQVTERLDQFFRAQVEDEAARAVHILRDRVEQHHRATSGFHRTLQQLQEGKVETLVLGRGVERKGARCEKCSFLLVRRDSPCPYCGGEVRNGIDLTEEMVRIAAEQEVPVEFVPAEALADLDGVGALLRF